MSIAETLSPLVAAYPNHPFERETAALYAEMLRDIPEDALKAAVLDHITSSNWFPTVAELRKRAAELCSDIPSAEGEWLKISRAIREAKSTPPLSRPAREALEAIGGWYYLVVNGAAASDRAHFFRIYEELKKEELCERLKPPQLKELIEAVKGWKMQAIEA